MASVSFPIIADLAPARSLNRPEAPAREARPEDEKFSIREARETAKEPREIPGATAVPVRQVDERSSHVPNAAPSVKTAAPETAPEPALADTALSADTSIVPSTPVGTSSGLIAGIVGSHPGNTATPATPTPTTTPVAITATPAVGPQDAASAAGTNQPPSNQTNAQAAEAQPTGIPSSGQQQSGSEEPAAQGDQVIARTDSLKTAPGTTDTQPAPAAQQTAASVVVGRPGQGATTSSDVAKSGSTNGAGKTAILDQQPIDGDTAGNDIKKPVATFATGTGTPPTASDTASKTSLPQTSTQIMAQAMANAPAAQTATATPDLTTPPLAPSATPTGDTLGVSHSFNAEMRAAIDAPTQAAAYTARGAMTAQPVAEQIAMQISRAADHNIDRMTVHLKPAELGKVTIELEIGPDHRLHAVISAERSETLDLLQRDAKSLDKALADAGIKTDSGSLQFNLKGDGGAAEYDRGNGAKLHDGAVMLPGETDALDGNSLPANTPLILPEGRINIQV